MAVERVLVMLQRRPIGWFGNPFAQIRPGNFQDVVVRQVVRHTDAPVRVLNHPHDGGDGGDGDLHGGGVLVRDQPAGFPDAEVAPGPPRVVGVAHQQRAEDVRTADDVIIEDALVFLELIIVTAEFVQRRDGHVGRAIGVMDRGPVAGLAVFPGPSDGRKW